MAVYRAAMSFDHVIVSPAPAAVASDYIAATTVLMAQDAVGNLFGLSGGVHGHAISGGTAVELQATYIAFYRETFGVLLQGLDPYDWAQFDSTVTPTSVSDADGLNGAGYLTGGTLAIEKDFAHNRLSFITPIGTINRTLDEMDGTLNVSANFEGPLWPVGHGHSIHVADFSNPNDERAQLFDFYQTVDGARFFGYALSAADPGVFQPYVSRATDALGNPAAVIPDSNTQLISRFQQEFIFNALTGFAVNEDQYRYIGQNPPLDFSTDMETARDHGVVWSAFVDTNNATAVIVSRTFDNGRHWERHTAFSDPLTSNEFPTLNWFKTQIIVTWSRDANDIVQAVSLDGGVNWNMPSTLPYTGTHPRHIIDKNGGIGLYFFFDGIDLKVARSFDLGATFIDASPRLVVAGVGAQTIDAEFGPDGSILVTLFVSGIWTKYRSTDFGRTWS